MADQGRSIVETIRVTKLACIECQHVMDVSYLPSFAEILCPSCGTKQTIPAKFGSFLLLGRLGSGGMGVIFHAVDRELGRHVALKVMKRSLGANPEFVESFKREAQAAAALNHRSVVQIYSFGQVNGQPYIAMELVNGGRLDEMIADGTALEETRALEISIEVAEGLQAASAVGLVHGDIKPANILFGQNGEAKVVDFGLASFIGQQQQGGQVWGTPYYIAPEKARGKIVDFRSDIYSLGAMLFHILAGQPPFDGATPVDVVMARLQHPAPSLYDYKPNLRPLTVTMVARMLELKPAMRYPSYAALLVDMRAALTASRLPLKPASAKSTIVALADLIEDKTPLKRIPWKLALIPGLVLAAVGLLAGILWLTHMHHARSAAAKTETQTYQEILLRGQDIWPRIDALAARISSDATELLTLQPTAEQVDADLPGTTQIAVELQGIVISAQTAINDVEDNHAQAQSIWQGLQAATNAAAAQDQLEQLDALFDALIINYNAIEEYKTAATNTLAKLKTAQKQQREAQAQAKQAQAAALREKQKAEQDRQEQFMQAQAAERLRIPIVQRELDLLDELRAANAPFIAQRRFEEAAQALSRAQADLTMDESKAYYQTLTAVYAALAQLKVFLVESIGQAPYRRGWLVGTTAHDIIAADAGAGISIALGSAGSMLLPWNQINLPQILNMAEYYLEQRPLAARERAQIMLGLALFCYESGTLKAAKKRAEIALQLDADLKDQIQRMMPELLALP